MRTNLRRSGMTNYPQKGLVSVLGPILELEISGKWLKLEKFCEMVGQVKY